MKQKECKNVPLQAQVSENRLEIIQRWFNKEFSADVRDTLFLTYKKYQYNFS